MNSTGLPVEKIEVLEDLTPTARCDEGFLHIRRLRVRNQRSDGTHSNAYRVDVIDRPRLDAVAVLIYRHTETGLEFLTRTLLPEPSISVSKLTEQKRRLLLVDDDASLGRMFSTLFLKYGYDVATAPDGLAGFQRATADEFDVILADLNMPRLDGWGMLRMMRDDFRTRELPVAFLSCHDDYRESLKALDSGAQGYFSKGTRLELLVAQVKKLIEPRERLKNLFLSKRDFTFGLSAVGAQWTLKIISQLGLNGQLVANDNWATYVITFTDGQIVHVTAQSGKHSAVDEKALNAFIASRNPDAEMKFGEHQVKATMHESTDEILKRSCELLNENERRIKDGLLASATGIKLNEQLYDVYRQVGPKQWLEAARLLCEERVPPKEIVERVATAPGDIEEMMKDLLRRDVISLQR